MDTRGVSLAAPLIVSLAAPVDGDRG